MKTGASAQAEQPCCKSKLLLAMQIQKNTRLQSEPFGCFCFKVPSLEYWEHLRTSQNISGRTTNQRQAFGRVQDRDFLAWAGLVVVVVEVLQMPQMPPMPSESGIDRKVGLAMVLPFHGIQGRRAANTRRRGCLETGYLGCLGQWRQRRQPCHWR
mmetsp:Transcript_46151/g.73343  ORF Transcript_46151/g.73343 Transcript_46151/m.73343 type:complete len:155 (+) Transcript_46151:145-609(+)